ncbi:NAD(P)/FAD-dependent oxidoreductase [Levilactobacillus brevis]|uniref:dihydrolipoyl dehydrogenase family protein n=1 Tax=Levilactobacillus brevis TaxID=1580 RepID=UPI000D308506|nr:NAD(P)/FAD-dependent oxidoreductase [Levilactobacillus brevis]MBU5274376.1 NAD(P)/FAD-dependent oxidoreductase [Levilactobacillus brevis]MBX6948321.1 NAD(P)/FAD-dependent oxidoreductase [Levilactobacillus brevis]MCT3570174.1 NAD(P)/FAD-dependent oxidoreductase [Levilactobacillus brevis]MCT3578160.1 NAD(P)/FAD-dependent oxidoreductase [Levilactobacillus brevis]MDM5047225.1 NAD(P)/FAD-dependent oxidoreductase [Levilactobacillus brevis]
MSVENYDYDVLYLGSGHGTFDGAIPLAAKGVKVAVVEGGLIGGTCPNRGCNAKITLDAPVALQRQLAALNPVITGDATINWSANMAHKHEVIDGLPDFIGGLLKDNGVEVITGYGKLTAAHSVQVGDQTYTADKIVLATGLHSHRLAIPGSELAHDSEDFLNLTSLPARMTVIGGGYIALELATIANAAGSDVTILLRGQQALRQFHQPFVETVLSDLTDRGVQILRETQVTALKQADNALQVVTDTQGTLVTDWVLDATGRDPNTQNLGLEDVGVAYTDHGITVNDHLQTSVPNIYASGDVIDKEQPKLTPTAIFESMYLSQTFAGETTEPIDYPAIPTVVFTSPRLAQVGVSVAQAQKDGATVETNHVPDDWYRQVGKESQGDNALIFDAEHHLIGATEVSEQAADVINTLLPAIEFQYGPAEIGRLVHLFPTIGASAWGQL